MLLPDKLLYQTDKLLCRDMKEQIDEFTYKRNSCTKKTNRTEKTATKMHPKSREFIKYRAQKTCKLGDEIWGKKNYLKD